MARYVVGTVKETPPGTRRQVQVAGITIALFNVDGTFYALNDRCPHQGGPLGRGTLVGRIDATGPGEYQYDERKSFVKCVWHGWEFELASGKSWWDPERKRVRPYPVHVEAGSALLEAEAASAEGRIPGPYLAETFRVIIEDEYVVVEVGR